MSPNRENISNAETWGVMYDEKSFGTGLSRSFTVMRAEELAAAAMTLAQALNEPRNPDYAIAFKDVNETVIQALARAHAANGNAKDAYGWARRIGSDVVIGLENDHDTQVLVEHATCSPREFGRAHVLTVSSSEVVPF